MDRLKKTDRLLKIWLLLQHNPWTYSTKDLALKFDVNVRTIYRDLVSLGLELNVPVVEEHAKWAVDDSYFLPPLRFTVPEALNIFLAIRLMLRFSYRYDPNIDSMFSVLTSALPTPLREQVLKTLKWMQSLPRDKRHMLVVAKLAEALTSQHCAKITYRSYPASEAGERVIEPYFIEPAAPGHSSYVLGYCHRAGELRTFKIERIENIEIVAETYCIPTNFDADKILESAWGIELGDEEQTVRLKCNSEVARFMSETTWHPSQKLEYLADGSLILTLRVYHTHELVNWVLGWGARIEVLEPEDLREEVIKTVNSMVTIYQKGKSNP